MAEMDYSAEEWRDIPGHENYEASSCGRIRKKAQILKPWLAGSGYDYVGLGRGYRGTVHRLVCTAFHGRPPSSEHKCVAHWDGNRRNNKVENLRWATYPENLADALRHGTTKLIQYRTDGYKPRPRPPSPKGADSPNTKLSRDDRQEIVRRHAGGETMQQLADEYRVGKSTIFRVLRRSV